ncbi:MAG: ABC transporter permease [Clostridiales bacterium]|nr:ABC transporter permease [Clostridiales bacterium]
MLKYIVKRLATALVSMFIVITVVFLLMRLMPVEGYFGGRADSMTEENKQKILENLGLLDPWYKQLAGFYDDLAHLDFGRSVTLQPKTPVTKILAKKMPYSIGFGLGAIAISLVLGCSLGVLMARRPHGLWDKLGTGYIVFINAVPPIVYYLMIQISVTASTPLPMLFNSAKPESYVLPLVCMALGPTANYAMWIRRYMVDELNRDYIKLARAKGMPNNKIMLRHVVRNAFIPLAQYLPSTILFTISGSIYVEALFSIPGMGGLLITSIQKQDNPVVQAVVLLYAVMGVFGLLLGDLAMAICDPRISLDKKGGSR